MLVDGPRRYDRLQRTLCPSPSICGSKNRFDRTLPRDGGHRRQTKGCDMTLAPAGILAIFNNVAPDRKAQFEEWFQHEHLQERLGLPGFLLGRRYEALKGTPEYFNFYVTR